MVTSRPITDVMITDLILNVYLIITPISPMVKNEECFNSQNVNYSCWWHPCNSENNRLIKIRSFKRSRLVDILKMLGLLCSVWTSRETWCENIARDESKSMLFVYCRVIVQNDSCVMNECEISIITHFLHLNSDWYWKWSMRLLRVSVNF